MTRVTAVKLTTASSPPSPRKANPAITRTRLRAVVDQSSANGVTSAARSSTKYTRAAKADRNTAPEISDGTMPSSISPGLRT